MTVAGASLSTVVKLLPGLMMWSSLAAAVLAAEGAATAEEAGRARADLGIQALSSLSPEWGQPAPLSCWNPATAILNSA